MRASSREPAGQPESIEVTTVPSSDHAFRAYVDALVKAETFTTPGQLTRRLRELFPRVAVRSRLLADEAPRWYVYRDGHWRGDDATAWWRARGVPRVEVTLDGWIRSVNRPARSLIGLDGASAPQHFTEFVAPGTIGDADALFAIVAAGHHLDATIRVQPRSGDTIACDLHAHRSRDGLVGYLRLADDLEPAHDRLPTVPDARFEPPGDVLFARYAESVIANLAGGGPDELAIRLRRLYPHAQVIADGSTWIVRRDRQVGGDDPAGAWWERADLPRVAYDEEGLILAANPAAIRLLGGPLVGRHWQDLVTPGSTAQVAPVLAMIREAGTAVSRFRMPAADGSLVEFDSHTRYADDQFITTMRPTGS